MDVLLRGVREVGVLECLIARQVEDEAVRLVERRRAAHHVDIEDVAAQGTRRIDEVEVPARRVDAVHERREVEADERALDVLEGKAALIRLEHFGKRLVGLVLIELRARRHAVEIAVDAHDVHAVRAEQLDAVIERLAQGLGRHHRTELDRMTFLEVGDTRKRRRVERLRLEDRAVREDAVAVTVDDDELARNGVERADARVTVLQQVFDVEAAVVVAEDQRLQCRDLVDGLALFLDAADIARAQRMLCHKDSSQYRSPIKWQD